ncbi:poly [ADP-ribose] polymerase tankyrase-1-like [Bacillus rossius redtenbacheri]|uniref:poly [ADP-ribose] polymerase tankyrase-1-like n=1 Tax=Bacillus rossius redtenbacheri TaxID=93214 RepID=UPI002FDEC1D4
MADLISSEIAAGSKVIQDGHCDITIQGGDIGITRNPAKTARRPCRMRPDPEATAAPRPPGAQAPRCPGTQAAQTLSQPPCPRIASSVGLRGGGGWGGAGEDRKQKGDALLLYVTYKYSCLLASCGRVEWLPVLARPQLCARIFVVSLFCKSTEVAMPTECIANPLQRELADSIIRMVPLDDIRILLACGAKANEPVTQGLRPLHYAVWQRYAEAARLLLVRGGDVDARDECGYSALHLAAEHGYTELVALLLHQGAQVDYRENTDDPFPRTTICDEPLRLAIRNRHYQVARMLLEHGADPNKRYFFGSEINLVSPLDLEFMRLLLTFGANPDTRDRSGLTPLMKAARLPQGIDSVLLLLSYGADVNAMTDARHDFRTVLHYAVLSGNLQLVNLLLKQGAHVNYPRDYQKPTPLDLAILKGDTDMIKLIIGAGANVNSSSPIIGSPLHVACADNIPNRLQILQYLLYNGADPNMLIESDEGPPLRPVLAEYISSNEEPCPQVINILLRYGAKVVIKTQFRDPHGILSSIQNLTQHHVLFLTLLEAAESFDICMIRRSSYLTDNQKELLLEKAMNPLTLRHQLRLFMRRLIGLKLPKVVCELPIPKILHRYLLYEVN